MTNTATPISPIFTWLVSLLVPLALVVLAVRLIMTPIFLQIEYRTPGFPADRYGFTLEDRLYWSEISMDVLVNLREISYVEGLQFEDGSPVYNERELGHWVDAIRLWRGVSRVGYGATIVLIGLGIWSWRGGWWSHFRYALGRGGLWTVVLMGVILVFVAVAFTALFTGFHQLFFPPGTWQFPFSDTFIRLFPQRFWRDTFIGVGVLSAGAGFLLWHFLVRKS
jgi:integral membrane protein (TIGR01906 family)